MAADFSRVLSNPLLDRAGVELKQGGLLLDADFNELVSIVDRRLRALASDVLGRATRGANTPHAFRITSTGPSFTIDPGRLYVDGYLVDNHGNVAAQRAFDDLLAEVRSPQPIAYDKQPYYPDPAPLPQAGRHLVYLDVWSREATHLEDPTLVDGAVGVDTSSRTQTVWQVRVLEETAGASTNCSSPNADVDGWEELIEASGGRLTTDTYEVAAVTDPCELPPQGGYRGLENQLYRVEIHDAGQPGNPGQAGVATFKWSRDNGTVASRVASIVSDTVLELDTLGRDDVLHFNTDDWVEVLDDTREFSLKPGEIRKITVDEETRRITLSSALPAKMVPGPYPNSDYPKTSHLRVRRWDQRGKVLSAAGGGATSTHQDLDAAGSSGVIAVPATGTTLLLENGVTVEFGVVGTRGFRSGDYWVFAARTSDASVEELTDEPPRGIHHHYARLAFWNVGTAEVLPQCPSPWPPAGGEDCACTVCVTPESHANEQLTIETAVSRVRERGGTVCLRAGEYALRKPVAIANARSVRIRGQGAATMLVASEGAFAITDSSGITIENLSIISAGASTQIAARSVMGLTLQQLTMLSVGRDATSPAITLEGAIAYVTIRENLVLAQEGIRALGVKPSDRDFLITLSMRIDDNILWCERQGIRFTGPVAHLAESRITGNDFVSCTESGIEMQGLTIYGAPMRISDNSFNVEGNGVRCAVDGALIDGNKLVGRRPWGRERRSSVGINLSTGFDENGSTQCQVLANQVSGFVEAGILIDAPVADLIVKQNIVEQCGNGIVMTGGRGGGSLSIENNHLRDIGPLPRDPLATLTVFGIAVARVDAATISGNSIRTVGANPSPNLRTLAAIAASDVRRLQVISNDVSGVAPGVTLDGVQVAGVLVRGPFARADIASNHVERDLEPESDATQWFAVTTDDPERRRPVLKTPDYSAIFVDDLRTLVIRGESAYVSDISKYLAVRPRVGSSVAMRGNTIFARGNAPAVQLSASGDIQFADNRCEARPGTSSHTVLLRSSAAVLNANVIIGGKNSLVSEAAVDRTTLVGNATTGGIAIAGFPPQAPWDALNKQI